MTRRSTQHWNKKKYKIQDMKRYIYVNHATWNLNQKLTAYVVNWKSISICAENAKWKIMISTNTVSRCLPNINEDDNDKYICLSCHGRLQKTDYENPIVPHNLKNTCVNAGAKFLKCLQDKPEYVCTCCHHMMFQKSVKVFNISEYRMNEYIVRKSLSYCYRMKL